MNILKFLMVITQILTLQSCDSIEPKIEENILIKEIDVSVSETYIFVSFDQATPKTLSLFRDKQKLYEFDCKSGDTIIADKNLKQNTDYKYQVKEKNNKDIEYESNEISITTLNATTHDIFWTLHTIDSPGGSAIINDVKVIDESNIIAVGEIYNADSNGRYQDPPSNLIRWNGKDWKYGTLIFEYFYGKGPSPATSAIAFSVNNIIVSAKTSVMSFNGLGWNSFDYLSSANEQIGTALTMWGSSEEIFYVGGYNGSLVKWSGSVWNKIITNTSADIQDIYGIISPINNQPLIFVAAFSPADSPSGTTSQELFTVDNLDNLTKIDFIQKDFLSTVWSNNGFPVFTGGSGIYSNRDDEWKVIEGTEQLGIDEIRGTGLNDIFAVGSSVLHFNGVTWENYELLSLPGMFFSSVDVGENLIVIAGSYNGKQVIVIGNR